VVLRLTVDNMHDATVHNRACKLFNIRLYATLCFNYFQWYRTSHVFIRQCV